MDNPIYYTPEEAEQRLREFGSRVPTADAIREQARTDHAALGFPVCVVGRRVYIPKRSFDLFWGIGKEV